MTPLSAKRKGFFLLDSPVEEVKGQSRKSDIDNTAIYGQATEMDVDMREG